MMSCLLKKFFVLCIMNLFAIEFLMGQLESTAYSALRLNVFGYLDLFYSYDFNQPATNKRQSFLYNHNRHHEFNINLGIIKLSVEHPRYKANLAFHSGTYVHDNYAAESPLLQLISEASASLALDRNRKFWIEMGIFPSHIGFESARSSDNWTLTRSIVAENTPYFLTGLKCSYFLNPQWQLHGMVLNGWQRIQRLAGNNMPSFGTQVVYTLDHRTTINWSTFIGTDDPDSTRRWRYYSNLFGFSSVSDKLGVSLGFDLGSQQKLKGATAFDYCFSPNFGGQWKLNSKLKTSLRLEYYEDLNGMIVQGPLGRDFRIAGLSMNVDYWVTQNFVMRFEGRCLQSDQEIFNAKHSLKTRSFIMSASLAVNLSNDRMK